MSGRVAALAALVFVFGTTAIAAVALWPREDDAEPSEASPTPVAAVAEAAAPKPLLAPAQVEAYAVDFKVYPEVQSPAELRRFLEPTYIKELPTEDGWGNSLGYESDGHDYEVWTLGRDGRQTAGSGKTTDFNADLRFANGTFLTYPEGVME